MERNLNNIQTFENFMGKNQDAYKAAIMLAGNSRDVSPLFIFGEQGTGKTFLLNAIGNKVMEEDAFSRVKYINADMFINEFILSLREHSYNEFKDKYQNLDYLLFDDLQDLKFIKNAQKELLNIVKVLSANNKLIAFGSSVAPNKLQWMDAELKSYIVSGISVTIEEYDSADKEDILLSKLETMGADKETYDLIVKDIIPKLARMEVTDIRELVGCLKRVIFFMKILDKDIDENVLKQIIS